MRYIKFFGGTEFCGCDFEIYEKFESISDSDLDKYASELAVDNAERYEDISNDYSVYEEDYASYEDYETAIHEAIDDYYGSAYCDWEEVSEEEYKENV